MKKYVVYYRVSTKNQGKSGLGLDAQKTLVNQFLATNKAEEIPPSFTEIESGRKNDRPELRKAINRCKETGATLLIAKIDRLARDVKFIFTLRDELESAGVGFIACDLPEANTLTLGIMASFAQHESERISQRLKAAFAEGRKRGKKYGNAQNLTQEAKEKAHQSISQKAREDQGTRYAWHFIRPLREKGISFSKIATMLNDEGYRTRTGKKFHAQQVLNIWNRFQKPDLSHMIGELIRAAKELNRKFGLDPKIQTDKEKERDLRLLLLKAGRLREPADDISRKTMQILEELEEDKELLKRERDEAKRYQTKIS